MASRSQQAKAYFTDITENCSAAQMSIGVHVARVKGANKVGQLHPLQDGPTGSGASVRRTVKQPHHQAVKLRRHFGKDERQNEDDQQLNGHKDGTGHHEEKGVQRQVGQHEAEDDLPEEAVHVGQQRYDQRVLAADGREVLVSEAAKRTGPVEEAPVQSFRLFDLEEDGQAEEDAQAGGQLEQHTSKAV
ncbi:hypothetical protein TYRP_012316 [Tyrophagus putrescentiae]|nr:hypothetical protein TYRP_012316 [Tyrophagus putrescentiae]